MSTQLTRSFVKFALLPLALATGLSACGAGPEDTREIPQTGLVIRDLEEQPNVVIRDLVATGEAQSVIIRGLTDGTGQAVIIRGLLVDGTPSLVIRDPITPDSVITVENIWDEGQAVIIRDLAPTGEEQSVIIRGLTDGTGQEVIIRGLGPVDGQGLVIRD